jgi:exodeoxyribonuclease (lambda-induced)
MEAFAMMSAEEKAAWLNARAGKLTASRMNDAMSFLKNGCPAAARMQYMRELLAERVTGQSVPHVVNDAMMWGSEHEDEAVDMFVEMTGRDVKLSRFYEHPVIENFGATPDRELDDGLLEVKCPTTATFLEWVMAGVVPERHKPQMTAQLLCTGKVWCGFVAYDPRIKDERRRLFLRKYEPTNEERVQVYDAAVKFLGELDAMFDQFVSAAA